MSWADVIHQILDLSVSVQLWMGWMVLLFSAAAAFLGRRETNWFLKCLVATLALGACLVYAWQSIHALALSHLIFWPPFIVAVLRNWRTTGADSASLRNKIYKFWLQALVLTMVISLGFDIRDSLKLLIR